MENKKFIIQEGKVYYVIEKDKDTISVTKFWKPVTGFNNSYGHTVELKVGTKRARVSRKNWVSEWATWRVPIKIAKNIAENLFQKFEKIEKETNEPKKKALAIELAKSILNLVEEEAVEEDAEYSE